MNDGISAAPAAGFCLPLRERTTAESSVAGRRDFRRLHHAEVMTGRGDFRCLYQLAAGMTGGSQFSSFYNLHLLKPPSDVAQQPCTRCKPGPQVTLKFRQFSIILPARMSATPIPLPITVLLPEHQIAAQFAEALARGYLGEQFFYWLPLSVEAWVTLCRSPEYRNADRALGLLSRAAPRLAELWPAADTLCGLGCGEGSKDRVLLEAFPHLLYIGSDFSQGLLEMALACAAPVARTVQGFKLDLGSDQHLAAVAAVVQDSGRSAVFSVLGNTLGALDPDRFPGRLRRLMRPEDRVLFDGEIFAGEETLRGYDHPTNRRFAFAPLASLGLAESDGELRFELRAGSAGLHEVVKYFVPARDLDLKVAGRELRLRQDDPLRMSSSLKYDEPAFFERIERGGFRVESSDKSDDGRFLLAAASPTPA